MKKIVSIVIFLTLGLQLSFAQVEGDKRFGFQLSPSFNWMTTNNNQINPSGTSIGLKLGMLAEFYFSDNYAVTSGIGFAFNSGGTILHEQAGRYWVQSDVPDEAFNDVMAQTFGPETKLKYSLQYVEIPIGLKLKTGEIAEKEFSYFLQPELTMGIRTQAQGTIDGAGDDGEDINIREEVELLNFSWGLGAAVEYGLNDQTSVIAGINTQFGFADVTDDEDTVFEDNNAANAVTEDAKVVTRAIIIKLGIMF